MEEIIRLAEKAELQVKDLINTKSQVFKKMNLDLSVATEQEILTRILENPRILKRLILIQGSDLILGFNQPEYEQRFL